MGDVGIERRFGSVWQIWKLNAFHVLIDLEEEDGMPPHTNIRGSRGLEDDTCKFAQYSGVSPCVNKGTEYLVRRDVRGVFK